jgi:hypothetical protein
MNEGGGSDRQFRNPRRRKRPKGFEETLLPNEEVQRRVDLREVVDDTPHSDWIGEASDSAEPERSAPASAALATAATLFQADPALAVLPQRVEAVRRERLAQDDRRRQLWRDSATILIGVVLALIVGQVLIPAQTAGPDGSPTPLPSTVAIGSVGPPASVTPGSVAPPPTFGPIVDPSLGIDASPTPIPVITMGPTPSPTPSPSPSVRPSSSIKPTPKPTPKPTKTPPPTPTPEPTPPPTPPPPSARFTFSVDLLIVTLDNNSTGVVTGETTWLWEFGDGDTASQRNPDPHTYLVPGDYTITLTMTTPVGTDSVQHNVTVPPSP